MTIRGWALGALLVILPAPASAQQADPAGQVEKGAFPISRSSV